MTEDPNSNSPKYRGSVIVPAHNEAERIGDLLPTLKSMEQEGYLVVVSCNGCTDSTAQVAKSIPGIHVLESVVASKTAAINRAENFIGEVFPRLYVDADAVIDASSMNELFSALDVPWPIAVRPIGHYLTENAPWLVRIWYRSTVITPSSRKWSETHLAGNAVYGTNAIGRERFDEFPPLLSDDGFFDCMFDVTEKAIVSSALVAIRVERSKRQLLRSLVRVNYGNCELENWIKVHRPESSASQIDNPLRGMNPSQKFSHYLKGGSTFGGMRPQEMGTVIVGILLTRSARLIASGTRLRQAKVRWR